MRIPSRILRNIAQSIPESGNVETIRHIPVMATEIVRAFSPKDGQKFLDLTFGGGGHTKHLLATNKKITVFCLDRDPEAFQRAIVLAKNLKEKKNGQRIVPLLGRFSELPILLKNWDIPKSYFDGAIMDLGTSSFQLEDQAKGFSVRYDGPLDMRMDGNRFPLMPTASDVVNCLDAEELTKIFKNYGEEKHAKKIGHAIVDARFMMKSINTTRELATLVENIIGGERADQMGRRSHPATKVFQALRIFVNNELNEINYGVEIMSKYLKSPQSNVSQTLPSCDDTQVQKNNQTTQGGLLAAISFHSLEDRIIKNHFMGYGQSTSKLEMDTDHVYEQANLKKTSAKWKFLSEPKIYPSENEIFLNPKARSATLRIGVRQ